MPSWMVVVLAVVALAVVVVLVLGRQRRSDGVESFRRQIDALGPEARRGVVDQVNQAVDSDTDPAESDETDTSRRWRIVRRDADDPATGQSGGTAADRGRDTTGDAAGDDESGPADGA